MMSESLRVIGVASLYAVCCMGCGQSADVAQGPTVAELPVVDAGDTAHNGLTTKLKFKAGSGESKFSLKPQDDGAKLVDADEQEIARFNLSGSKLKVKGADDVVLGYIIASDGKFKIKNADQSKDLWKLQRQDDGDWKLEDGNDKLFCKIKRRDYGFEIEDNSENSQSKIKVKDGKTSLRDSSDTTILYTKDQVSPIAFVCMGLDPIDEEPLRAALMTMLIINRAR
ncbi:MAG: hypothetical protein ABGZ23_28485 [Fuerstiella sp.]|nr:hypothetical protein [Fuerstiella sp.]